MSTENDNVDSSSSESDMEHDSLQPKSGLRGDGEVIIPVNRFSELFAIDTMYFVQTNLT